MKKQKPRLMLVLSTLLLIISIVPIAAQGDDIIISLAMPELISGQINQEVFDRFEAEHPGIRVNRVSKGEIAFGISTLQSVDDYLDSTADYVSAADVLAVTPSQITMEATRAGYFLDLTPLIASDPNINPDDFFQVMYDSYQWDEGFWALPVSADMITLIYRPQAFDAAGVAYPEPWWTMDDLEDTIRALAVYDDNGNVTTPAFLDLTGNTSLIFLSLMGQGIYDDSVVPSVPTFDNPLLEDLMTRWAELRQDGLVSLPTDANLNLTLPLALGPTLFAASPGQSTETELALLPGGQAGLSVNAFAISSGTQYPEAAYELVKFLTESPEVANAFLPTVVTARRSIADVEVTTSFSAFLSFSEQMEAVIDIALENGLAVTEARFAEYVAPAIARVALEDVDARVALQDAELDAIDRLQTASDRANDVNIVVATPPPEILVEEGETSIRFGIELSSLEGIPHEDRWNAVIADFVAADSEVGEVVLEVPNAFDGVELVDMSDTYDCYYLFSNVVQSANISHLRNIDPLTASDPTFDANDFPGSILALVQRDGQTWAMPLVIQPQVMAYNPQALDLGGAPHPYAGWTISDFENILRTLKVDPEDPAPFTPLEIAGNYVLSFVVAYGGLPFDYRTSPITVNFTDEATVSAIRQVLDLAKDGFIQYNSLTNIAISGAVVDIEDSEIPLFSVMLNEFFFDLGSDLTFAIAEFPQGQSYTALAYDLGAAYISVNTPHAEACYRFISEVGQHPELFTGMPVRRSQLTNPQLEISQGEAAVEFYQRMDALIDQPNAILMPTGFSNNMETIGDYLLNFWLFRAFDRYVLEDNDLEAELADAEAFTVGFQQCVAGIPSYEPKDDIFEYFGRYTDCALQVDPTMEGVFLDIG